jgi:hypothetical protein
LRAGVRLDGESRAEHPAHLDRGRARPSGQRRGRNVARRRNRRTMARALFRQKARASGASIPAEGDANQVSPGETAQAPEGIHLPFSLAGAMWAKRISFDVD